MVSAGEAVRFREVDGGYRPVAAGRLGAMLRKRRLSIGGSLRLGRGCRVS